MRPLSLVTSNPGKVREFRSALGPLGFELRQLQEEIEEIQADSLEEVVRDCMRQLAERGIKDYVLDDSGLFIDRLHGFPGVYSAYTLKTLGCGGVLKLLEGALERGAEFRCCIGCHVSGREPFVVSSLTRGRIIEEERGSQGFGFDPIFVPEGHDGTFAEMPLSLKNKISHRGKAIKRLAEELKGG